MNGLPAFYPTRVILVIAGQHGTFHGILNRLMINGVEYLNDGALRLDRVRHINAGVVQAPERLCQKRLAVSRLAINQERISGAHRRADLREHSRRHHHAAVGMGQCFRRQPAVGAPLPAHDMAVLKQRNRRRHRRIG